MLRWLTPTVALGLLLLLPLLVVLLILRETIRLLSGMTDRLAPIFPSRRRRGSSSGWGTARLRRV
jgi:hypothetical protein